jgi:His/Glu/Gln/Arg/opine family amino acid ABC transporter permease subunit
VSVTDLWNVLTDGGTALLRGLQWTVLLVVLSFAIATLLGAFVCVLRCGSQPTLRAAGTGYVEVFRNVPLLVLIFALYLGLRHGGVPIGSFAAAVASLSLYSSAYIAEALRSGVLAVEAGQAEAAAALGLPRHTVWVRVVLPQSARLVIAPMGNLLISMIRNSAVAGTSILAIPDLMNQARQLQSQTFLTTETFFWAAAGYLALTAVATAGVNRLDRRLAVDR